MESQKKKSSINFKRIHSNVSILSKFLLKRSGKKDGKKSIPFIQEKYIISPNVKKEHDKVYAYMAYIMRVINNHNASYYHESQSMIAELETKVDEAIKLSEFLKDKPSEISVYIPNYTKNADFENYLKSKHKLETELDDISIRQRRFEEYQNRLSKYRTKLDTLSIQIIEIYKNILVNLDIIRKTIELSEPIFGEVASNIDMRLSWYWQGVILKHPQAEMLKPTAPEPKYETYTDYLDAKKDELEKLQQRVESIYTDFKDISL